MVVVFVWPHKTSVWQCKHYMMHVNAGGVIVHGLLGPTVRIDPPSFSTLLKLGVKITLDHLPRGQPTETTIQIHPSGFTFREVWRSFLTLQTKAVSASFSCSDWAKTRAICAAWICPPIVIKKEKKLSYPGCQGKDEDLCLVCCENCCGINVAPYRIGPKKTEITYIPDNEKIHDHTVQMLDKWCKTINITTYYIRNKTAKIFFYCNK